MSKLRRSSKKRKNIIDIDEFRSVVLTTTSLDAKASVLFDNDGTPFSAAQLSREIDGIFKETTGQSMIPTLLSILSVVGSTVYRLSSNVESLKRFLGGFSWSWFALLRNLKFLNLPLAKLEPSNGKQFSKVQNYVIYGENAFKDAEMITAEINSQYVHTIPNADAFLQDKNLLSKNTPLRINVIRNLDKYNKDQVRSFVNNTDNFESYFESNYTINILLYENKKPDHLKNVSHPGILNFFPENYSEDKTINYQGPDFKQGDIERTNYDAFGGRLQQVYSARSDDPEQPAFPDFKGSHRAGLVTFAGYSLLIAGAVFLFARKFLSPIKIWASAYSLTDMHCVRGLRIGCKKNKTLKKMFLPDVDTRDVADIRRLVVENDGKAIWIVRPNGSLRESREEISRAMEYYT